MDLSAAPEPIPGGPLAPWLPLAWLFGLGIWAALNPARLPARLIVHYGLHGPDRWVARTPQAVVALIGLPALGCLLLAATAYGVLHWSRRISTSGPAASSERQFRRLMVLVALTIEYLLAALPVLFLLGAPQTAMRIWAVVLWSTLIVFFIRLVRAGQGGSRVADQTARVAPATLTERAAPGGDRTDDAHWLGGMIYVNRADRAVFVEKRMGIGWTLNFGNLRTWLLLALVLAIPLLLLCIALSCPA